MNKAFGYVRCAVGDAPSMTASIAYQLNMISRASAVHGCNVQLVVVDITSGDATRVELDRLLERATLDGLDALVVADATRLTRKTADLLMLQARLGAQGVEIVCGVE